MKDQTLYDRLGVSPTLTHLELRRKGKKLMLKWHPDKNPKNAEEASKKFILIKEALDILTNPEKREKYHQIGMDIFSKHHQDDEENTKTKFIFPFPFPASFQYNQGISFHYPQFKKGFPFPSPNKYQNKEQVIYELKVNLDEIKDDAKQFTILYSQSLPCNKCKCKNCGGGGNTVKITHNGITKQTVYLTCFLCGGLGSFRNENCKDCNGTRRRFLSEKSIVLTIKKDILRKMIQNHDTITVKSIDHNLIIIPVST